MNGTHQCDSLPPSLPHSNFLYLIKEIPRDTLSLTSATFRNTSVHTLRAVTMPILWLVASQRSLHNAPIFRLLLKVAVNGTHQCDSIEFLRDRKIPTTTKFGVGDKVAALCHCRAAIRYFYFSSVPGSRHLLSASFCWARREFHALKFFFAKQNFARHFATHVFSSTFHLGFPSGIIR